MPCCWLLGGGSLARTLEKYVAAFQKMASPFFQERIFDIKDVFRRVMWHLLPQDNVVPRGEGRLVLVAHEASVLDLFSVDLDHLVGVVIEHGSLHSHAVILARSLGIPMVGQVAGLIDKVRPGQFLRVNGSTGEVEFDPRLDDTLATESAIGPVTRSRQERPWFDRHDGSSGHAAHRGEREPAVRGIPGSRQRCARGRPLPFRDALSGSPDLADGGGAGRDLP